MGSRQICYMSGNGRTSRFGGVCSGLQSLYAAWISGSCHRLLAGLLLVCLTAQTCADDLLSPGMEPARLMELLDSEQAPLVVDLRAPVEYRIAHIPGAINIPLDDLEARIDELRNPNGVLIYCLNGARTRQAEPILYAHNVENIYHLKGTLQTWLKQQLPYEKGGVQRKDW
jgi:rhodanese-related sulfurtransferase